LRSLYKRKQNERDYQNITDSGTTVTATTNIAFIHRIALSKEE
jgi:hypothetical protein